MLGCGAFLKLVNEPFGEPSGQLKTGNPFAIIDFSQIDAGVIASHRHAGQLLNGGIELIPRFQVGVEILLGPVKVFTIRTSSTAPRFSRGVVVGFLCHLHNRLRRRVDGNRR